MQTLAFDVYGTLIDPAGVTAALVPHAGDRAAEFAQGWREKQLEYAFRRSLMQDYRDFDRCTRDALRFTAARLRLELSPAVQDELLAAYAALPPFPDAAAGLAAVRAAGFRVFAFSNGVAETVDRLLVRAGLRDFFADIVSADEVGRFKPDPGVYRHFLACADATPAKTWLVSSNPFDVLGARAAGLHAAWVRRSPEAVMDPWDLAPTTTVATLTELPAAIRAATAADPDSSAGKCKQ